MNLHLDPDYEQSKLLWAAVLAAAIEDACTKRKPNSARVLNGYSQSRDREKLEYCPKAGYAHPSRSAVLSWMADGVEDTVEGSFGWVAMVLGLNPWMILEAVRDRPETISKGATRNVRYNIKGVLGERRIENE